MSFIDLDPKYRIHAVGDTASRESAIKYFNSQGWFHDNFGFQLDGGSFVGKPNNFYQYSPLMQRSPDLYVRENYKDWFLVELKGTGASNYVNVFTPKLDAYVKWNDLHPMKFFINKSDTKQIAYLGHDEFMSTLDGLSVKHTKNMMESYYSIPCNRFIWMNAF